MKNYVYAIAGIVLWCSCDIHVSERQREKKGQNQPIVHGWWKEREKVLIKKEQEPLDRYRQELNKEHREKIKKNEDLISKQEWEIWKKTYNKSIDFTHEYLENKEQAKKRYATIHAKVIHSKAVPLYIIDLLREKLKKYKFDIDTISITTSALELNKDFYIQPPDILVDPKTFLPKEIKTPPSIVFNNKLCTLSEDHKDAIKRHIIIPCVYKIFACHDVQRGAIFAHLRAKGLASKDTDLFLWKHQQDLTARFFRACHSPKYYEKLFNDYYRFMDGQCALFGCKDSKCVLLLCYAPLACFYYKELTALDKRHLISDHDKPELLHVSGGMRVQAGEDELLEIAQGLFKD